MAPEVEAGRARRVPGLGAEAFVVDSPTEALVERLHAGGHCLGCRTNWWDRSPSVAGVYTYVHDCERLAGPYRQVEQPATPARLEDLPGEVRATAVKFDGRFAETPLLQPVRHWPCDSWGSAWLDLDLEFDPPPQPVPPTPAPAARAAASSSRPWWKFW